MASSTFVNQILEFSFILFNVGFIGCCLLVTRYFVFSTRTCSVSISISIACISCDHRSRSRNWMVIFGLTDPILVRGMDFVQLVHRSPLIRSDIPGQPVSGKDLLPWKAVSALDPFGMVGRGYVQHLAMPWPYGHSASALLDSASALHRSLYGQTLQVQEPNMNKMTRSIL